MNMRRYLYIKKRTFPQWLTLFIFAMPFFLPTLLQLLNLPGLVKYTIDVAWIGTLATMCVKRRIETPKRLVVFAVFVVLTFTYCLIVYLFKYQSLFYFLWGVRNNYRFYIAFLACGWYLTEEDVDSFFQFLDGLFWVNAVVSIVQFVFLGFEQDYLGGIFGVETGSNASTAIFFSIILSRSVLLYLDGKEKTWVCWAKCATGLLIASLAELKFFFLVFMLILLMTMALTKASWKKIGLLSLAVALVFTANAILDSFFQSGLSFESILKLLTASSYSTQQDLGRLTAIPTISRTILLDAPSRFLGMGLGNCDTSSFAICNTPFFVAHQDLHYDWFSSAFLYLETGYIGLVLHFAFYVICFVAACRTFRRKEGNRLYQQMAMIVSVLCVILVFYNSSLRTEAGYMAYFVLALPLVGTNNLVYDRQGG